MKKSVSLGLCLVGLAACAASPLTPLKSEPMQWSGAPFDLWKSRFHPKVSKKGMAVSDDERASQWGERILEQGGSVVDAGAAVAFMLAVTRPHYGSLGGGGFAVFCPANRPSTACETLDFREVAPRAMGVDAYKGQPARASQDGARAAGIPGVVAGWAELLKRHGKLSRAQILKEPLRLAREGVEITPQMETAAYDRWSALNSDARALLGCGEKPCPVGHRLVQNDLARVLETLKNDGWSAFYEGAIARRLVRGVQKMGGVWSAEDLKNYRAEWRRPIIARWARRAPWAGWTPEGHSTDFEIVSMGPPSAGGILLSQMLGYAERAERDGLLDNSFAGRLTLAAIEQLAYADRAEHLGDPQSMRVAPELLLEAAYLDRRWQLLQPELKRKKWPVVKAAGTVGTRREVSEEPNGNKGLETTHFSVIDAQGNALSVTTTVNDNFGSGFVPKGTGIFLNNEMDDFSRAPGEANLFGLVGSSANAIHPGRRPLSSMTPTIVRQANQNRLVLGAAGGPRITTSVFGVLLERLLWGASLPDAVAARRVHHQWKPDLLKIELPLTTEEREQLQKAGVPWEQAVGLAKVHALERFPETGRVWGAPDPRGEGN